MLQMRQQKLRENKWILKGTNAVAELERNQVPAS